MTDSTIAVTRTEQIARLNDRARLGLDRTARIVITRACLASFCAEGTVEGLIAQAELMKTARGATFTADTPERDFAVLSFREQRVFLKIDYYDETLTWGAEDPADAARTVRVVTIMLPEDL